MEWTPEDEPSLIGKGEVIREGSEIAILGMVIWCTGAGVADLLGRIASTVVNMLRETLDTDLLKESQNPFLLITYEDHS